MSSLLSCLGITRRNPLGNQGGRRKNQDAMNPHRMSVESDQLASVVTPLTSTSSLNQETKEHFLKRIKKQLLLHKGLVLVFIVCFVGACGLMVLKMLAGRYSSFQITTYRQASIGLLCAPFLLFFRVSLRISRKETVLLAVLITTSTFTWLVGIYAFGLIPAGDATAIMMTSPILTGILAKVFLGEKYTVIDAALALVTLVGVTVIARPTFIFGNFSKVSGQGRKTTFGVIAALAAAVGDSFSAIIVRKQGTAKAHQFYQHWIQATGSCVLSGIITTIFGAWQLPECGVDRVYLTITGCFAFFTSILMRYALKYEKASNVAICSTNIVVFYVHPRINCSWHSSSLAVCVRSWTDYV